MLRLLPGMTEHRRSLAAVTRHEEEIKRSRFVAIAAPCASPEQALSWIDSERVSDASHHCYAWRIGQEYRFNDDGEPSGTAGKPILQAIDGQPLDQVVVLVIRWFGGVKLGAGGLIRAYGGSAARCLQQAATVELVPYRRCRLQAGFDHLGVIHQLLNTHQVDILQQEYLATGVEFHCQVAASELNALRQALRDASSGQIQVQVEDGEVIAHKAYVASQKSDL
ncbi:MAG: IMPACT family protein [Wenzhouxiangellaceae bacterium]